MSQPGIGREKLAVARLAAVIDWARKAEIGPLSDCGHHRTVVTIRKLAHWRETGGGDRSCRETGGGTVGTIAGELTLSQKYNGEHYRIVGTIAGDLTLSLGTDTIAKIQR